MVRIILGIVSIGYGNDLIGSFVINFVGLFLIDCKVWNGEYFVLRDDYLSCWRCWVFWIVMILCGSIFVVDVCIVGKWVLIYDWLFIGSVWLKLVILSCVKFIS